MASSLIAHMLLMIVCGLWVYALEPARMPVMLTVSAGDGAGQGQGDEIEASPPMPEIETTPLGELLAPEEINSEDPFQAETTSDTIVEGELLGTQMAEQGVGAKGGGSAIGKVVVAGGLSGRTAARRGAMAHGGGGTAESEAAVKRGLRWLARHQSADGRWSLNEFSHDTKCDFTCDTPCGKSDVAGTALALLPFLGAGQTSIEGEYSENVARGIEWLISKQHPNGDLRGDGQGKMYAHGQATIALCEAYALTQDPAYRQPAQRAVDFIVWTQHKKGGWRYVPGQPGDTSVLGWQVMALRSAQMAYLEVPEEAFERAARYLDQAQCDTYGGQYAYQPGGAATPSMSAEAILCRMYGGWQPDDPGVAEAVRYLTDGFPPNPNNIDIYYWYYGTQVLHHYGGRHWGEWNQVVRETLIARQGKRGCKAGSWDPAGPLTNMGGRIYMTSLALCTLEVYYRHLPLYKPSAIEK